MKNQRFAYVRGTTVATLAWLCWSHCLSLSTCVYLLRIHGFSTVQSMDEFCRVWANLTVYSVMPMTVPDDREGSITIRRNQ